MPADTSGLRRARLRPAQLPGLLAIAQRHVDARHTAFAMVYICACVCARVHACVRACVRAFHVSMCVCVCLCRACVCMCMYVCMYVCVCVCVCDQQAIFRRCCVSGCATPWRMFIRFVQQEPASLVLFAEHVKTYGDEVDAVFGRCVSCVSLCSCVCALPGCVLTCACACLSVCIYVPNNLFICVSVGSKNPRCVGECCACWEV